VLIDNACMCFGIPIEMILSLVRFATILHRTSRVESLSDSLSQLATTLLSMKFIDQIFG
jgi:hypothetical protein